MLMAVVICSLAVNAQDAIANGDTPTATSTVTVLENYGTDVKSENFTLLQHDDTLVSDAELLKSIAEDTTAKRLKKAKIFKWTAWVGGSSEERISYDCICCSGKLYKKTKIIGDCSFIPLKLTNFAHILQFF